MPELTSIQMLAPSGQTCATQPIVTGIPVPAGRIFEPAALKLVQEDGQVVPTHFQVTAKWPDRSIRWLLLYFQLPASDSSTQTLSIHVDSDVRSQPVSCFGELSFKLNSSQSALEVDTGAAKFQISLSDFKLFEQVTIKNRPFLQEPGCSVVIKDATDKRLSILVKGTTFGDETNPMQRTVTVDAAILDERNSVVANGTFSLTFFAGSAHLRLECTLHNQRAASHPNGQWDLGDTGSFLFNAVYIEFSFTNANENLESSIQIDADKEWQPIKGNKFCLYQESSGGENWQSENHVNAAGEVPLRLRGYRVLVDDEESVNGLRADPIVRFGPNSQRVSAHIQDFWQNCPKAIELERSIARLHLFPGCYPDAFELQGGEQKTHSVNLSFGDSADALQWCREPAAAVLSTSYVASSQVFPLLQSNLDPDPLQQIIRKAIDGSSSFFIKREVADEYGWRHYGEIYADHEELSYTGDTPLVSHYNNQYDVLDGLLRQYLLTGDHRWFDLAAPLARHVIDIDIYRTDEDKDEYNFGLFWHTDHYLSAHTCTHRTWSNKNDTSCDGEPGGGPGSEHCYTSGLVNFYFLTGSAACKESVLQLVRWITRTMEGSATVLSRTHRLIKRDLKDLLVLFKGGRVSKHTFPLTRATGNYLSSVLDAFQLTGDADYMRQAESIVRKTVHPKDEISHRGLDRIETGWSYLVFLQSLAKLLFLKSAHNDVDASYWYTRDCFLLYASWMLDHEQPFLESVDQLDFPNHTWVAQDLRKAYILQVASSMVDGGEKRFAQRAEYFRRYVESKLHKSSEQQYTRIITLLMQSYLPLEFLNMNEMAWNNDTLSPGDYDKEPTHSLGSYIRKLWSDYWQLLKCFSFRRELRWLRYRLRYR